MKAPQCMLLLVLTAPVFAGADCLPPAHHETQPAFETLDNLSERLYDGNGSWGHHQTGYRMALRDSAWRADVYGALAPVSARYRQRADEAANYLVHAQQEGGSGAFGLPADGNHPEFGSRIRQIKRRCPDCIRNAWVVTLPAPHTAELYYDHGFALGALARAHMRSGNPEWLAAIRRGADWALGKPVTDNINYLSTLSKGLSLASLATGDQRYVEQAILLHQRHILPRLTPQGEARDTHNARLEYHAFIVSGLATLRQALPAGHAFSPTLDHALSAATARLTQRTLQETAENDDTWPGAALLAWHDLASLRPLTTHEQQALNRTLTLASRQASIAMSAPQMFHRQKTAYVNFSLGYFIQAPLGCTPP